MSSLILEAISIPLVFENLPMPPSSNNQYYLARRGKKTYHVPSKELERYKRELNDYYHLNRDAIQRSQQSLKFWLSHKLLLQMNCRFFFERKMLYTLKGAPKKMDVSNRLKAAHDGVAKLLEIDDSLFFKIEAEKREVMTPLLMPSFSIEILPFSDTYR